MKQRKFLKKNTEKESYLAGILKYYIDLEDEKKDLDSNQLKIDYFQLSYEKNKKRQELFYHALTYLIDTYNTYGAEECRNKNIYYIQSDANSTKNNALLANITDSIMEEYFEYKNLFSGLLNCENKFFSEYNESQHKKKGNSRNSVKSGGQPFRNFNNLDNDDNDDIDDFFINKNIMSKSCIGDYQNYSEKKFIYNLDHYSFYFNGVYFEEIAVKYLFKLINENNENNYESEENIKLLPKMIFYEKNSRNINNISSDKESPGYTEMDCCFILKKIGGVKIEKEKITRFMNLEVEKVSDLCNFQNCQDLDIKENSVVIMEIKSSWLNLYDCQHTKNPLEYFVDNALLFIEIYKKLNLIEEKQDIIFIYMFNNSMAFNIKKDSRLIQNEIEKLNKKNINLYIAFFQPYCKLLSFYEENRKYNNLVTKTKELENRLEEQKKGFQKVQKELENRLEEQKNGFQREFEEQKNVFQKELEEQKNGFQKVQKELENRLEEQKNGFQIELENRLEEQKNGFQNQIKELKEFFKTFSSKNNFEDKETIDSAIRTESSDKMKDGDSIGNSFGDN